MDMELEFEFTEELVSFIHLTVMYLVCIDELWGVVAQWLGSVHSVRRVAGSNPTLTAM